MIELIIVIAILGILTAILVPTMLNIVGDSKNSVDRANARSVYSVARSSYVALSVDGTVTASDLETKIMQNLDEDELSKECIIYLAGTDSAVTGVAGVSCGTQTVGETTETVITVGPEAPATGG